MTGLGNVGLCYTLSNFAHQPTFISIYFFTVARLVKLWQMGIFILIKALFFCSKILLTCLIAQ
jgi:hypothetical protein